MVLRISVGIWSAMAVMYIAMMFIADATEIPEKLKQASYAGQELFMFLHNLPLVARVVLASLLVISASLGLIFSFTGRDGFKGFSHAVQGKYKTKYQGLHTIDQADLIYKDRRISKLETDLLSSKKEVRNLKFDIDIAEHAAKREVAKEWRLIILNELASLQEIESELKEGKKSNTKLNSLINRAAITGVFLNRDSDFFPEIKMARDQSLTNFSAYSNVQTSFSDREISTYGDVWRKKQFLHCQSIVRKRRIELNRWMQRYESYLQTTGKKIAQKETNSKEARGTGKAI